MSQSLEAIFSRAEKGEIQYIAKLLLFGRQRGFDNVINRKLIWPLLLEISSQNLAKSIYEWEGQLDKNSSDYQQLQKDAERALSNMKIFQNITKFHLQKKQRDVLKILDNFFAKNLSLKYIQGFHDVASIFLILFGNSKGYYLMEKAGKAYFRDFLTKDLSGLATVISELIIQLITKKDPEFVQIFQCFLEMKLIIFIIPWILTWFAHVFPSAKLICRIWDYILCAGPHGIIYLTAAIILSSKNDLVNYCSDFDQASIHTFYQQMVKNESIDIEKVIKISINLQSQYKIETFEAFKNFDSDSVFRIENFKEQIDIHERVKVYINKIQEQKSSLIKTAFGIGVVAVVGGFIYLRYGKKLSS